MIIIIKWYYINIFSYNINLDNLLNEPNENNYESNIIIKIKNNQHNVFSINSTFLVNYDNVKYDKTIEFKDLLDWLKIK